MLLERTELASASVETICSRLLKIGARLRRTARRLWVHWAGGLPSRELMTKLMKRIAYLHPPPLPRLTSPEDRSSLPVTRRTCPEQGKRTLCTDLAAPFNSPTPAPETLARLTMLHPA